jgi:hypothetical protein
VERPIDVVLHCDQALTVKAAKTGKSLPEVAGSTRLGQSLEKLAPLIAGDVAPTGVAIGDGSLLDQIGGIVTALVGRFTK